MSGTEKCPAVGHSTVSSDWGRIIILLQHCLAGWEASKPAVIPAPSALDLRSTLYTSQVVMVRRYSFCPHVYSSTLRLSVLNNQAGTVITY